MKKKLKGLQSEKMKGLMGDGVARVFLKTLVSLIGEFSTKLQNALKCEVKIHQ